MTVDTNLIIDIIQTVAPHLLTTIGGITIAKIGSNNKEELTAIHTNLKGIKKVSDSNKNSIEVIRNEVGILTNSNHIDLRYTLYRDLEEIIDRGWTTLEERREMAKLFEAYEKLGGNGEIKALYCIYCGLPLEKEYKHEH